jgi:hypothetical protein
LPTLNASARDLQAELQAASVLEDATAAESLLTARASKRDPLRRLMRPLESHTVRCRNESHAGYQCNVTFAPTDAERQHAKDMLPFKPVFGIHAPSVLHKPVTQPFRPGALTESFRSPKGSLTARDKPVPRHLVGLHDRVRPTRREPHFEGVRKHGDRQVRVGAEESYLKQIEGATFHRRADWRFRNDWTQHCKHDGYVQSYDIAHMAKLHRHAGSKATVHQDHITSNYVPDHDDGFLFRERSNVADDYLHYAEDIDADKPPIHKSVHIDPAHWDETTNNASIKTSTELFHVVKDDPQHWIKGHGNAR